MRLKYKIQHYLSITDRELKFLLVLASILTVGSLVQYAKSKRVPDFSEQYALIDSLTAEAGLSMVSSSSDSTSTAVLAELMGGPDNSYTSPLISINTGTVSQLTALPGIGPAIARRIVDYREKYGRFVRKEELLSVQGIGPRTFERLQAEITL